MLAVLEGRNAGAEGRAVAVGALDEAAAACGQVVHDLGLVEAERGEVDQIEVRALAGRDHVLRLRVYRGDSAHAELGWKGPTSYRDGYKVREEIAAGLDAPDVLADILGRLEYVVTIAIDREIWQYEVEVSTVRFERYPRMDDLF